MQTLVEKIDFSDLHHDDTGKICPLLLDDFRFGNQRGKRTKKAFDALISSVGTSGIISPVTVWRSQENPERLELIAGHGRRDAALANELSEVPFVFKDVTPAQAFAMHIKENEDREDVSFIAKSQSVMRYMTEFKGDIEAVASQLNLSVKKCRELIEINKCSDKVKAAISDGHITPSHAILLAPFPRAAQDKNLPTIISEKWSVNTLRQRVGKAKLPLERAVFDKNECENCEFNSIHQRQLFAQTDDKAQCAKPPCFQAKTTAHMHAQKEALQEKYGHVLLLSETNNEDRNAVSAEVVGNAQFEICQQCDSRVAVLSDAWGKAGEITQNQCVDNTCFSKCKTVFSKEVSKHEKVASQTASDKDNVKTLAVNAAKNTTKKSAKGTLPKVVSERYQSLLRSAAKAFYDNDKDFVEAILVASLISQASLKVNNNVTGRFSDVLPYILTLDSTERKIFIGKAIDEFLCHTDTDANHGSVTTTLIACMKVQKDRAIPFVREFWEPTDENLSVYTKELLEGLSSAAGVNVVIDAKEKGAFSKLKNKSKKDFIKGIQSTNVNWKDYAPKSLLSILSK